MKSKTIEKPTLLEEIERNMIKRYGKKYGEIAAIKQNFLLENDRLLEKYELVGSIYRKQPPRMFCKLCNNSLDIETAKCFISHKITYKVCPVCQHVNGVYDDTSEFSETVYCEQDYGHFYSEENRIEYNHRKEVIYRPKFQFLKDTISLQKDKKRILEIGAGSGYFCAAANDEDYNIVGIEISERQVEYANKMINKNCLKCVKSEQIVDAVRNTNREIVVAIGVIEHIYNMQEILTAIKENTNIEYFYFSVPLFSLSVFFEMMFQDGFNRQLGGAHTHLFTMESINYMNEKYGFDIVGQWIFGTDIADLYRLIQVRLQKENKDMLDIFQKKFSNCLDSLQKTIDEFEFASEVHMVTKVTH